MVSTCFQSTKIVDFRIIKFFIIGNYLNISIASLNKIEIVTRFLFFTIIIDDDDVKICKGGFFNYTFNAHLESRSTCLFVGIIMVTFGVPFIARFTLKKLK